MSLVNPLNLREIVRPGTVAEALDYLGRQDRVFRPLAGGTALLADQAEDVEALVDLGGLGLRYVHAEGDALRVGAMTTLQEVVQSQDLASIASGVLVGAAQVAAPSVQRHQRTVGGTLVAGHAADDLLVALAALGANVVMWYPGQDEPVVRSVIDFLHRYRAQGPYLLTEVRLPPSQAHMGGALERVARTPADAAIVNAVALVRQHDGVIDQARVAVGGVARAPVRLPSVEDRLVGSALDDALLQEVAHLTSESVQPEGDWRASAEYRQQIVGVLVRRALARAWASV